MISEFIQFSPVFHLKCTLPFGSVPLQAVFAFLGSDIRALLW